MESLRVALGARAYTIHLGAGILERAELYAPHIKSTAALITDEMVAPLYAGRVRATLESAGARVVEIVVEKGERAKGWPTLERIFDRLLEARLGRDVTLVALGGGVIGDLAGFSAAIYQRGVPFIQVPTTLLAQVDSSVGGKTAINHPRGKNMIGAFHQPVAVISDVAALDTLSDRELRAGVAEVIKHGAALDEAFFAWLEDHIDALLARERTALLHAVRRSCELKAAVVAQDERETGQRALLNLGHTFGHAIEAATGFGPWLHGEAVAAGMVLAAELSARAGLLPPPEAERIARLVARAGLPTRPPILSPVQWQELMSVDKKTAQGRVRFVLLEGMGRARLHADVDARLVDEVLAAATQPLL
ncbi:MAG: 3-dehydroquinate synthase [Burkholderiales bacterium]